MFYRYFKIIFLFTLLFTGSHVYADVVRIYPSDDAVAQLYDDDAISEWSEARNYQGLVFREPFTSGITNNIGNINVRSDKLAFGYYRIYRVSSTFDLSVLPNDAQITSASLSLYRTDANTHGDTTVVVTSHVRSDESVMQRGDWNIQKFGNLSFSERQLSDYGFNLFTLNQNGLNYLNSKKGQIATLGLLTSYDFYDIEPPLQVSAAGWHEIEKEGTSFDPYLEITYTVPGEDEYPLYTQIVSEHPSIAETTSWVNDPFAGGSAGSRCPTIAACGCTITSTVMLARSYGITRGVDGTDVNPGNFNRWLTANNGYRPGGNLDFSQAIKYFGVEENGIKKSFFTLKDAPLSGAAVKQRVSSGVPVVSQMNAKFRRNSEERGSHFVLVTKQLGAGQYGVNDPIWYNTKNLDDDVSRESWVQDYNDQIVNGRDLTFTATPVAVANAMSAALVGRGSSPTAATFVRTTALLLGTGQTENGTASAEMFMITPSGGRLGTDPRTGQNFTLATGYYGTESFLSDPLDETAVPVTDVLKTLSASELTSGTYRVVVVGTGSGSYVYSGLVHDSSGQEHPFSFSAETAKGMVDVYTFSTETGVVTLLPIDLSAFNQIIDGEVTDEAVNKFFKLWAAKITGEIAEGKLEQAKQHIETFRTLMKAKKVNSPTLELLLKKLEVQTG